MASTWFKILVKLVVLLTCITSAVYLTGCSWTIAETVKKEKSAKVELSCLGVSVFGTIFQFISSLGLLLHCGSHISKHSKRWIWGQVGLLVLLLLTYLVPFSFDDDGSHATVHQFWHKTSSHVNQLVKRSYDLKTSDYLFHYGFVLDVGSVVIGVILVGVGVWFARKDGYHAVS